MAGVDNNIKMRRKHKSKFLPEKLKSPILGELVQSVNVLSQVIQRAEQHEGPLTPDRVIKTLVRGLGSSNVQVQKNYFAALVSLMKVHEGSPEFSARNILQTVESELHISKNTGKGEEGEILIGKVLAFGVLVRSEALAAASEDDQNTAVAQFLQDVKGKSYLPLIGDAFLVEFLKQVNESVFKKTVWPHLCKDLRPGPMQTVRMYHILLVCEDRFPSVVSSKFLNQTLGGPKVISTTTVPSIVSALKNDFKLNKINSPAYQDIFKYLANSSEELLQAFWHEIEMSYLSDSATFNKHITAINFLSLIILKLDNALQILNLLTPEVLSWFLKKHKVSVQNQKILNKNCSKILEDLYKLCAKAKDSKTSLSVIKKLLVDPGNMLFEQISGTRVVQQLMGHLKEKSVKKLGSILRDVITGNSSAVEYKDSKATTRPWTNKEKLSAVHTFCKLLALPAVRANKEWRLDQLTFLADMGFFPTSHVGVELAGCIRESFFSCLNHNLPNLDDLRYFLAQVVEHIDNRLNNGDQLRIKVPTQMMPAWKKMLETAKHVGEGKKYKKEKWVAPVFQTMFFHIGLHLLKESAFAADVLQELHSVYDRVGSTASNSEEPHWTEVVVEMFLSLLSRNSQLHRHLIGCIFGHFCPIMIPQNIHQILQVLDPNESTNPLLHSLDTDSESTSSEEDSDGEDVEGKESSDDDDDFSDEEEEDDKVNDKLRRAVFEALGDTGAVSDVESLDIDDMDEEEAARVDRALSEAFRANKQAKTKKQPSHAKALTHFRLRVLDLIEMWIGSGPPLDLMVDTLLRLVSLLEHCLVDKHQAPLETRLRTVIKKLTSAKKYDVSDCKSLNLGNILKSLLEKGNRTTTVYMSIFKELTACTLFIAKASQYVDESYTNDGSDYVTVHSVLKDSFKSFFLQRDCLLVHTLFEELLKLQLTSNFSLLSKLPNYAFDPNVHPFRRNKALEFLITFWKNNRLLLDPTNGNSDLMIKIAKRLYNGSIKMMEEPAGRIKPKFINLLKLSFGIIRKKKWLTDVDLEQHLLSLAEFQKTLVSKTSAETGNSSHGNDQLTDEEMDILNGDAEDEEPHSVSENENKNTDGKEEIIPSDAVEETSAATSDKEKELSSDEENEHEANEENEESASDSEEPPTKKSKKRTDKKRRREKMKRLQLLKNNSKRLRLESMAVGLEENVFSKYKVLADGSTKQSPKR